MSIFEEVNLIDAIKAAISAVLYFILQILRAVTDLIFG